MVRDLGLGDLYGRYLYMDLCVGELRSLNLGSRGRARIGPRAFRSSVAGRATSFGEDADCRIYVASLNGPVYRLTEPGGGAARLSATPATGAAASLK